MATYSLGRSFIKCTGDDNCPFCEHMQCKRIRITIELPFEDERSFFKMLRTAITTLRSMFKKRLFANGLGLTYPFQLQKEDPCGNSAGEVGNGSITFIGE